MPSRGTVSTADSPTITPSTSASFCAKSFDASSPQHHREGDGRKRRGEPCDETGRQQAHDVAVEGRQPYSAATATIRSPPDLASGGDELLEFVDVD